MTGLSPDPSWGVFSAAADVTATRVLGNTYTNGSKRRFALVTVLLTASVLGQANLGFTTSIAGQAFVVPNVTGLPLGVALGISAHMIIPVDPGATYGATTSLGSGAASALQKWLEVDF